MDILSLSSGLDQSAEDTGSSSAVFTQFPLQVDVWGRVGERHGREGQYSNSIWGKQRSGVQDLK